MTDEANTARPGRAVATPPTINQQQLFQLALGGPIPRHHGNVFAIAQTATDMAIVVLSNNSPVVTINLSYESAKSLVDELTKSIDRFERASGAKIKSLSEIQEAFRQIMEEQ